MKTDIVLCGVGGQGVLMVAAIIAWTARRESLHVKQGEVHGMAQRGGSVQALLRLSDEPIDSDLIPRGTASLVLGMEPLEALRHLDYLAWDGTVVTSVDPIPNFAGYPPIGEVLEKLQRLPRAVLLSAEKLARELGSALYVNTVMVGAASPVLPVQPASIEAYIREAFARKGSGVVEANLRAFRAGRDAVLCGSS